ncbi:MAG: DUF4783 domain-containing protein [Ferruginibacter sp.]
MKKFITLSFLSFIMFSFTTDSNSNIDDIIIGLRNGNADQVAKYFDNTVEITLPEKSNSYSKSQGGLILTDFFTNNNVKGFDVIHRGENAGSQYCIGTLHTRTASYRTTLFMKLKGDKQALQEIRFENR